MQSILYEFSFAQGRGSRCIERGGMEAFCVGVWPPNGEKGIGGIRAEKLCPGVAANSSGSWCCARQSRA